MGKKKVDSESNPDMLFGFHIVSFFCVVSVASFLIAAIALITFVSPDSQAESINGHSIPYSQWSRTQSAFATSLFLDLICWLWTVHKEKARLFHLAMVINGIPVITYTLLSCGAAPVLMDLHGKMTVHCFYAIDLYTTF